MTLSTTVKVKKPFSLREVATSHGWSDVAPLAWNAETETFYLAQRDGRSAFLVRAREKPSRAKHHASIEFSAELNSKDQKKFDDAVRVLAQVLRLDFDLAEFYDLIRKEKVLGWVVKHGAGRILRGQDDASDVVKMIFQTNIAWKQAVKCINRVAAIAPKPREGYFDEAGGRELTSFPKLLDIANKGEAWLAEFGRVGYRAPFIVLSCTELSKPAKQKELEEMHSLDDKRLMKYLRTFQGIGKSSAASLMNLFGRYSELVIDSGSINCFQMKFGLSEPPTEKDVERHYARFGRWKSLVCWLEMVEHYRGVGAAKG
ncbi:MAG: hypothetical protein NUW37_12985 [Planctomycetes bacterium]|nr:hypothetical protein [Planctomycetota bacterium]